MSSPILARMYMLHNFSDLHKREWMIMATVYEVILQLCEQKGIKPGKMCSDLGISRSTVSELKSGRSHTLKLEKAQKIADYFGVGIEVLLSAPAPAPPDISIEARAEQILSGLTDKNSDTLMLDGKPASPEAIEAFKNAIMVGIELARRVNKEKKDE